MQPIIKKIALLTLLTTGLAGASFAQTNADLAVTGTPANGGTYPGFVYSSHLEVTFLNNSLNNLNANSFRIQLALPNGVEFDATYPGIPTGWSYTKIGPNDARLTPTSGVALLEELQFLVPFKTTQSIPSTLFTAAQIIINTPVTITDPTPGNNNFSSTIIVQSTPLPVQFHSFDGKAKGCDVQLDWVSTNESRNSYFDVERSADGITFESIAKVNTELNPSDRTAYHFTDKSPVSGANYYRVSQVDLDGKSYTTRVLTVNNGCIVASQVSLFPNPASETVHVKGLSGTNTVRLFNVLGQQIFEGTATTNIFPVPVKLLPSGAYQIQVVQAGKTVFSGKFVKAD